MAFNPDFKFLESDIKIQEATKLNEEFESVYKTCDDWSIDDCDFHLRLQFPAENLTDAEYEKVLEVIEGWF